MICRIEINPINRGRYRVEVEVGLTARVTRKTQLVDSVAEAADIALQALAQFIGDARAPIPAAPSAAPAGTLEIAPSVERHELTNVVTVAKAAGRRRVSRRAR